MRRLALLCVLVGGAAFAGCGGGGPDEGEDDALRGKLEKGFERLSSAPSFDLAMEIEVGLDGETSSEGGCLKLSVDKGGASDADDQVEMRVVEDDCEGLATTVEVRAIGRDIWVKEGTGEYRPGRIDPRVLTELTDDNTDFSELASAATGLHESSEPGTFGDGDGVTGEGPKYEFSAPASAFSQAGELGDPEIDFEITQDAKGYMRQLIATASAEGTTAGITQTYENIGSVAPIEPPAESEVSGPLTRVHSEAELESLLEDPLGGAF